MLLPPLFLFTLTVINNVFCANILYIDPVLSPSHHLWNEVLVNALSLKGHNITLIGHYNARIKAENYTVLKIEGMDILYEHIDIEQFMHTEQSLIANLKQIWDFSMDCIDADFNSSALAKLLDYPRNHFDLIIFDITCGQYLYPLIEYFGNPPVVSVAPIGLVPYMLDTMGDHFYSYYPIYVTPYMDNMSFLQRVYNFILYQTDFLYKHYYINLMEAKAKQKFGKNIASFDEAMNKIGVLLVNYDPILDFPQPIAPHIIPVGGLHMRRPTELPQVTDLTADLLYIIKFNLNFQDLKRILDTAPYGVVYFSFGTNVQPSWLSIETKRVFLEAFRKLKQTVLWKYGADDLTDIPENVVIRKWFPQTNILSHKNCELFITHGGALSTHETMYYGVPVVAIPIYLDQKANAIRMENKLLGKRLDLRTITVEALYEAIQEVLINPKYSQNVRKISQAFKDQEKSPLEKAVFWVETIIMDNGKCFQNSKLLTFLSRHNVKFIFTPIRHPISNPSERSIRELQQYLRIMCNDSHTLWSEYVPVIEEIINVIPTTTCEIPPIRFHSSDTVPRPWNLLNTVNPRLSDLISTTKHKLYKLHRKAHEKLHRQIKKVTVFKEGMDIADDKIDIVEIMNTEISLIADLKQIWDSGMDHIDTDYDSEAFTKLLEYPRNHFDLIIIDITCRHYFYPLIEYFGNPPVVSVAPIGLLPYILDIMGDHFYSYYPIYVTPYTDNMSFFQRVYNFILYQTDFLYRYYYINLMEAKAKQKFGRNIASFDETMNKIGVLLVNYDPILDFPQPIAPHIIPVGGLHMQRPTELPQVIDLTADLLYIIKFNLNFQDLKRILDTAPYGVVYFSFGTNVQPSWLPIETKRVFLEAFRKLKQTVLWKYGADDLTDIPENVVIRKWFPQTNILSHKNCELFITHGGALSTQETMYYGVPVVAIPIYLDQKANAIRMENKLLGKRLDLRTITVEALYEAIQEVLINPKYSQNVRKISQAFKDQEKSPLEKAVFWVDYSQPYKELHPEEYNQEVEPDISDTHGKIHFIQAAIPRDHMVETAVIFENLLLSSLKKTPACDPKQKNRLALGAEVITSGSVTEKLQDMETAKAEKTKKVKKVQPSKSPTTSRFPHTKESWSAIYFPNNLFGSSITAYTITSVAGADSILEDIDVENVINSDSSLIVNLKYVWDYSLSFTDIALNSTALEELLSYPRNHFDLIIFDFSCGQYMYPLLNYFGNPPTVAVSPFGLSPSNLNFMGSHYYSYYPIYVTPYTDKMDFIDRIYNFILYQASAIYDSYYTGVISVKVRQKFDKDIPSYEEAMRGIGLLLDLQQILDNAQYGVIYFSFGTNVQPSWLTMETKMIFLEAFRKLKQTVLWKYNGDDLKVVPKNVIIKKWFPQTDILSHENVELFITHCGGLSTQESMYHGVPLVGIPIFLDQKANAIRIEKKSLGKRLNLTGLNVEDLYETIQEVLSNPKYLL
ncbi:UDP-glucosyltransferase [Holotrichia oblita]|uniref:UDP-glucosyltransferase n=1 Tax=Holotrichia oblita TaxID=644536 RepID=A0ACB9TIW9_HOLOL|nr:UDP-glucosyltransferase [Holotrichia oblita]